MPVSIRDPTLGGYVFSNTHVHPPSKQQMFNRGRRQHDRRQQCSVRRLRRETLLWKRGSWLEQLQTTKHSIDAFISELFRPRFSNEAIWLWYLWYCPLIVLWLWYLWYCPLEFSPLKGHVSYVSKCCVFYFNESYAELHGYTKDVCVSSAAPD